MKIDENKIIKGYAFTSIADEKYLKDYTLGDFKKRLKVRYAFGNSNIICYGFYKEMGFLYNLKPYLNSYLVNIFDNHYERYYAFNKKQLLDNLCLSYKTKIIEDNN